MTLLREPDRERRRIAQTIRKHESAFVEEAAQAVAILRAEHAAEHADRQEVPRPARHPLRRGVDAALRVARQAATSDDAMHVRMMVQVLAPGVQ